MFAHSPILRPLAGAYCLVAVVLGGEAESAAKDFGHKHGTQWTPHLEWTVHNATWEGNPFDVRANVVFTHEDSGVSRETNMFYVGKKSWAFRFAGDRTGVWSFTTSSSDGELSGLRGRVENRKNPRPDARGFLKNIDGKWGWQGTQQVFVPQLVMWDYIVGDANPLRFHDNPRLIDAMIQEFIVEHGFTGFHVPVIGGRWFDINAASDRVEASMSEPDPRTFEALELLIAKTHAAGGMVHIWPWGDASRSQTPHSLKGGIGGPVDQRLQRYIAARLGPVAGWSMGYGFDLDEWVKVEQLNVWHDAMHQDLGWPHFLGGRPVGPNRGLDHAKDSNWNRGLDYASYEHHRPTYDVYLAATRSTPSKPVMSEDRFRIREGRYRDKDYSTELTRRGLYHSTMAGGVASIWGIHPDLSPGGIYPNRQSIKTYSTFFHDKRRFLHDTMPAGEVGLDEDTRVLWSRSANSLLLYHEDTARISIDLSSLGDSLPAVAVDTKKPYAEVQLGVLAPRKHEIRLPAVSDWVIAIGRFAP